MNKNEDWYKVAKRIENFHLNYDSSDKNLENNKDYFIELNKILIKIIDNLLKFSGYDSESKLKGIFRIIYDYIAKKYPAYYKLSNSSFYTNKSLDSKIFDACFFTALCAFLHHSKKIKGKTLRDFLYDNSEDKTKGNHTKVVNEKVRLNEDKFMQGRHRLLTKKEVFIERTKWAAMAEDSEYEWSLYFELDKQENADFYDTYKRFKNLYNDIENAITLFNEDHDKEKLEVAYKKFASKLKKIKYEDFLELNKFILSHICQEKTYYGINIYRLEKSMNLFKITYEVNRLLQCKNEEEKHFILTNDVALNPIYYPKLYEKFIFLLSEPIAEEHDLESKIMYSDIINDFNNFKSDVVFSFLLLADVLIDYEYLDENWKDLFLSTINKMTEQVFYSKDEINYTILPTSQENFIIFLDYFVKIQIENVLERVFPKQKGDSGKSRYTSDMTESQWEIVKEILKELKYRSVEEKREQVNAALYVIKTGCQWRNLPEVFPNWKTVYSFYQRVCLNGTWDKILQALEKK